MTTDAEARVLNSATPAIPVAAVASWAWALGVGALTAAVYTWYSAWQWTHYAVKSWDLGIFTELFQRYAAWQAPIVDIKGPGFNLLGDHFHPLLVVFTPVFALFPHAFTLLVIQNLCFGAAAAILTRTARRLLGPVLGVALGCAFGLSWGLQYAVDAQFHEIALAVPLLTASLCALLERRWAWAIGCAALLVFVKEDLGWTVAVIAALIAIRARNPRALWLAVWGVGWFAIATFVVLPALNPGHSYGYNDAFAPLAALSSTTFWTLAPPVCVLLIACTGGLMLRSPIAFVVLPTLAWRTTVDSPNYWGLEWHYNAVLMPVAFAALIDGALLLRRSPRRWLHGFGRWAPWVASGLAAASLVVNIPSSAFTGHLPLLSAVIQSAPNPRAAAAGAAVAAIPDGATVETDIGLMSYVVDDHLTYFIENANPAPGCILLDRLAGHDPVSWAGVLDAAERLHPGIPYVIRYHDAGYQLACRSVH